MCGFCMYQTQISVRIGQVILHPGPSFPHLAQLVSTGSAGSTIPVVLVLVLYCTLGVVDVGPHALLPARWGPMRAWSNMGIMPSSPSLHRLLWGC